MFQTNILPCEMIFDDHFYYEVSCFGVDIVLEGYEIATYLAGIIYEHNFRKHWDDPVEQLATLLGEDLTINYIPT